MKMTVVALLCRTVATINAPVCHEEVVTVQEDMSARECMFSQPAVAQWKANSIYREDIWSVQGIRCVIGTYVPKRTV